MSSSVAGLLVAVWIGGAVCLGYLMARLGFDPFAWLTLGMFLGPVAVAVAAFAAHRMPRPDPQVLHAGRSGRGVDVLVAVDGSPASAAAARWATRLFAGVHGRVTFARVVPVDAAPDVEEEATRELEATRAAHVDVDASTVLLRGEPVRALRAYARALDYEVLVAGARGRGGSQAVLGRVASRLARGPGVPVLLVDADETLVPLRSAREEAMAT